jgi:hypothetical protein
MTNDVDAETKKLIRSMVRLFQERKQGKRISARVYRGRAAPVSYEFENRFAMLLKRVLPDNYSIYVDYPISYKVRNKRRKTTSYPDILIVEDEDGVVGIIEVKIDLGYLNKGWIPKNKKDFSNIRHAKKVTYRSLVRMGKRPRAEFRVSEKISRAIVLLTDRNDHGRLPDFSKQANCFILITKFSHPNSSKIKHHQKDYLRDVFTDKDNIRNRRRLSNYLHRNFN